MNTDVRVSVRNVTAAFRKSTPDDRIAGLSWYSTAREVAAVLDPDNPVKAAAIIAVLSPKLSWPKNVEAAQNIYAGRPVMGALGLNITKAKRIMAGGVGNQPEDVLSGPKVTAFWHTIAHPDDPRAVVVDRHAVAVAAGRVLDDATRNKFLRRKSNHDEVVACYQRAATILTRETGQTWTPAAVQATTWEYWRRERADAYHGNVIELVA